MARYFRFYSKKRGGRRTGTEAFGHAMQVAIFAIFLVAGFGFLSLVLTALVIPEWRANRQFRSTTCQVLDKRVGKRPGGGEPSYRPEIQIRYVVDGTPYQTWTYDITGVYSSGEADKQKLVDRFEKGESYPCWYDPLTPQTAVLKRGYTWFPWLLLLLPAAFIVIGGGGITYRIFSWGMSAERQSAQGVSALPRDLLAELSSNGSHREYPGLPDESNLTNSPGTKLQFRLPADTAPTLKFLFTLAVAVVVDGLATVFAVMAIRRHLAGEPDWFLTLFALVWLGVGGVTLYYFARQLLIAAGVGPTIVEISNHPLIPRERYRLMFSQVGRLRVNSLKLLLTCEETAHFHQGTNTRTDSRRVYEQLLFERNAFEIESGMPFETELEFEVPGEVMHSFRTDHNEINWKFVVMGDVAGWPDFARDFPVVVYPPRNGRALA